MDTNKRIIAATELVLIFPVVLFLTAVVCFAVLVAASPGWAGPNALALVTARIDTCDSLLSQGKFRLVVGVKGVQKISGGSVQVQITGRQLLLLSTSVRDRAFSYPSYHWDFRKPKPGYTDSQITSKFIRGKSHTEPDEQLELFDYDFGFRQFADTALVAVTSVELYSGGQRDVLSTDPTFTFAVKSPLRLGAGWLHTIAGKDTIVVFYDGKQFPVPLDVYPPIRIKQNDF